VPPPAPVASATKVSVEADLPAGLEPGSGTETSDVDKPKKDSGHVDVSDESHRKVIEANDGEIITVPRRNTEISPKNAGSAQPD
jgi:hypothetical protein